MSSLDEISDIDLSLKVAIQFIHVMELLEISTNLDEEDENL